MARPWLRPSQRWRWRTSNLLQRSGTASMADPGLNLFYVHSGDMGYGRMGVNLARSLAEMGITVFDSMPMPEEYRKPHEVNPGAVEGLAHVVCWASVPSHMHGYWEGQYRAVLTMWEAQRLPESFRETLPEFDLVMVPSHHNVELFSRYHDNV